MIAFCIFIALMIILLIALVVPEEVFTMSSAIILSVITVIGFLAISFFVTAGIIWLICWAFSLTFSWKITFGIWLIILIINNIFKKN